ncbi:Tyrosine recombinase XerD [compost metagenome]
MGPQGTALDRELLVRRFQRISKLTGIKVTPHGLRRSFATATAHKNVPLDKLQKILGHSDVQTTMLYVRSCSESVAEEMRDW